jgi:hypothetical protein
VIPAAAGQPNRVVAVAKQGPAAALELLEPLETDPKLLRRKLLDCA